MSECATVTEISFFELYKKAEEEVKTLILRLNRLLESYDGINDKLSKFRILLNCAPDWCRRFIYIITGTQCVIVDNLRIAINIDASLCKFETFFGMVLGRFLLDPLIDNRVTEKMLNDSILMLDAALQLRDKCSAKAESVLRGR